ncbi:MAG: acyltransferase [Flavobacteriales bacterium]|nr:MAG: acyltransferase [Flavobacteriales bacterium]
MEERIHPITNKEVLPFKPLSVEICVTITEPLRKLCAPQFFGMDNIDPKVPTFFVANHTIYGLFDGPLFIVEAYRKKGVFMRALVDNVHHEIPIWGDYLTYIGGAVRGTRENCSALMENKEHILVYPGGARESFKQKGEKYKLTWKKRSGFARMAIEHGYRIIPIAGIGGDDTYDIIFDSQDIMKSALGKFLENSGLAQKFLKNGEEIPPIAKGIGKTIIPKPQKFYYSFGKPIDTKPFKGKHEDKEVQMQVRKLVEESIYKQFEMLKEKREKDTDVSPLRKFLNNL